MPDASVIPLSSLPAPRDLLWIAASYALGCLAAAYYITRWRLGHDIRRMGSGTVGARNTGRVLGASGFLTVFVLDALKGGLAVGVAPWISPWPWLPAGALLTAVIGHCWPLQLGFHGGKGIAVTVGGGLTLLELARRGLVVPATAASGIVLALVLVLFKHRPVNAR